MCAGIWQNTDFAFIARNKLGDTVFTTNFFVTGQHDSNVLLSKCIFVGKQPNIVDYLSASDVLLLPSEQESFGLAALEAMACEVPVIASHVGGLPEGGPGRLLVGVLPFTDDPLLLGIQRSQRNPLQERVKKVISPLLSHSLVIPPHRPNDL